VHVLVVNPAHDQLVAGDARIDAHDERSMPWNEMGVVRAFAPSRIDAAQWRTLAFLPSLPIQEFPMSIETLCKRHVVTIDADAPLRAAARTMRDQHVGALVVTSHSPQGTRVAGIVTDRDIVIEVLARELDPGNVSVGDVTRKVAVAIPARASIADAVATMREEGIRRLLVFDTQHHLVGIVTLDDLIEALAGEMTDLAGALRAGAVREEAVAHGVKAASRPATLHVTPDAVAARWRQISAP